MNIMECKETWKSRVLYIRIQAYLCGNSISPFQQSVVVTWLVLASNTNNNSNVNNNINMQVKASDIYKVFKIWKGSVLLKGLMCNLP